MRANAIIDWWSCSYHDAGVSWSNKTARGHQEETRARMWPVLRRLDTGWTETSMLDYAAQPAKGYEVALRHQMGLLLSGRANGALMELSGTGCAFWRHSLRRAIAWVRQAEHYRSTRIDVAVDFQTAIDPLEFASARHGRMVSHSSVTSPSGRTEYVGSRRSDRYARVYVYHHGPRAGIMRVELVARHEYAAMLEQEIAAGKPLQRVVAEFGNGFGWQHDLWHEFVGGNYDKLAAPVLERSQQRTMNWLYTQVTASIIKQAQRNPSFDWDHFVSHIHKQAQAAGVTLGTDFWGEVWGSLEEDPPAAYRGVEPHSLSTEQNETQWSFCGAARAEEGFYVFQRRT